MFKKLHTCAAIAMYLGVFFTCPLMSFRASAAATLCCLLAISNFWLFVDILCTIHRYLELPTTHIMTEHKETSPFD
jgi:hypothetical protein